MLSSIAEKMAMSLGWALELWPKAVHLISQCIDYAVDIGLLASQMAVQAAAQVAMAQGAVLPHLSAPVEQAAASLPDPVLYAIPAFFLLLLLEIWAAWRSHPERYEPRDTWTSLALGVGSQVTGAAVGGAVVAMAAWVAQFQPLALGLSFRDTWWAWIACFVLDDLAYYWFHRTAHRVRWFWASHVIHHSSQHYNLSTALRQTWTGFFSLSFLFRLPLFLIFPVEMVLFCGALNLIYQFWIHTEVIGRMPAWFEAVMNTPSHHRVHHGVNPRYLDSNYAGVFIIWDKMFGSFVPERDDEPVRYGIVKQLGSFNLLWAAVHEWVGIAQDMWRAPWRHKLNYLLREPGWSHDGSRLTSAMIKARWEASAARKGNRSASGPAERSVSFQNPANLEVSAQTQLE